MKKTVIALAIAALAAAGATAARAWQRRGFGSGIFHPAWTPPGRWASG